MPVLAPPTMRSRPLSRDHGGDRRSLELAARIEEHQRVISSHEAAMLHEIAEFDRAESWRGDGCLNMAAWLMSRCRVGTSRANTLVAAAEKVEELPRLSDALSDGRLTLDVLAPLAAVATPESDAKLAASCDDMTVRQARELNSAIRGATDHNAAKSFQRRCVRFDDSRCTIWMQLQRDMYAGVKARLVGMARRHDHPNPAAADYEPLQCRLADAVVELALTDPAPSASGSSAGSTSRAGNTKNSFSRRRPTVVIHVDLKMLAAVADGVAEGMSDGGYAFIPGIGPISREVARRLTCDALHMISIDGPTGNCLDLKPFRRDPTTAQRIAIGRRDNRKCRWPGCDISSITDVHHMHEYEKGGPTILSNLITLCTGHHSRVHELGWKMSGDANGKVTFTSPHGRDSRSSPSPMGERTLPMRK